MNTLVIQNRFDLANYLKNYLASVSVVFLALQFYVNFSNFHKNLYGATWQIQTKTWKLDLWVTTPKMLIWLFVAYAVLMLYQTAVSEERQSKGALIISGLMSLFSSVKITHSEKQALLNFVLKFFFIPFIVNAAIAHFAQVNYKIVDVIRYYSMDVLERPYFVADIYDLFFKLAFAVIYTVDVVPFLVGYLIDTEKLHNKIKSVEFTVIGWFFCLICYPPFNTSASSFFPSVVPNSVAVFSGLPHLHYLVLALAAGLLALYASASVSLGFKASNLTSRGVVDSGLYGYIRHPAYICKNAAWWVFALAWAYHQAQANLPYLFNMGCLCFWTWIYYMRAVTEEKHMLATDPDYVKYCERVPFRFIPNIV